MITLGVTGIVLARRDPEEMTEPLPELEAEEVAP